MPFILGYEDAVPTALVEGGSCVSTLPVTNVQTEDLQEAARFSSLDPTDTYITIDLGGPGDVGMIVIGLPNASPTLQYRVRSFSDASMSEGVGAGEPMGLLLALTSAVESSLQYDSTLRQIELGTAVDWADTSTWLEWEDVNFWDGISPSEYDDLPIYVVLTIPLEDIALGQAQFWKIEFFDETNPDGYLDVTSVMLFRAFRPENNYEPNSNSFEFQFLQDMTESKGGRRTYTELALRRVVRFQWPYVTHAEGFHDWMRIGLLSRTSRRIFIIPEETDTGDSLRLRAFPATFSKTPALQQLQLDDPMGTTSVDAEEVL